jgi:hypothetical protein
VISMTLNFDSVEQMQDALAVMLTGRNQPSTVVNHTPIPDAAVTVPVKVAKAAPVKAEKAPVKPEPVEPPKPESAAATPAASVTTTPPAEPAAPAAVETATASPSKAITLEEVRAVLAKLSQAGKAAQVKALISEMGASNLSTVAPEKFGDLLEKAAAL